MLDSQNSGGQNTRILDEATYQELLGDKRTKQKRRGRLTKASLRSIFGIILLVGYLLIIGTIVISDIICNGLPNASDLLAQVGMLLSSPLSFVIGYYYNKEKA